MQLDKMIQTNLFNELSDKEQEVVAGGTTLNLPNGNQVNYVAGSTGSFQYGNYPAASWGPGYFQFGGQKFSWGG